MGHCGLPKNVSGPSVYRFIYTSHWDMKGILNIAPRLSGEPNSGNIKRNNELYSITQGEDRKIVLSKDYGSTFKARGRCVLCLRTQKGVKGERGVYSKLESM